LVTWTQPARQMIEMHAEVAVGRAGQRLESVKSIGRQCLAENQKSS
jgi:hypothetical protein